MFGDDHIDEITDWQAEFIIRVGEDIKPFMGIKAKQLFVLELLFAWAKILSHSWVSKQNSSSF